jgi:hypothetical protein
MTLNEFLKYSGWKNCSLSSNMDTIPDRINEKQHYFITIGYFDTGSWKCVVLATWL